jgi:hypothetical protein
MGRILEPGRAVALVGCRAHDSMGEALTLHGLYELVEYLEADRDAGVFVEGWLVVPEGTPDGDWEARTVFVDAWDVFAQTDPQGYGRAMALEREADLAELSQMAEDAGMRS